MMRINNPFDVIWYNRNTELRKSLAWLFFVLFLFTYPLVIYFFWDFSIESEMYKVLSWIFGLFVFPYLALRMFFRKGDVAFLVTGFGTLLHLMIGGVNADDVNRKILLKESYAYYGVVKSVGYHKGFNVDIVFDGHKQRMSFKKEPSFSQGDTVIVKYNKRKSQKLLLYKSKPDSYTIMVYKKPVLFKNNVEIGNDYYYYAKLRTDLALKNFGLNKVIGGKAGLQYRNINDSLDSQFHQCEKDLQTPANKTLADSGAFYFHGEIIPMKQVFEEIPQAKEYYYRYVKSNK